MRIPDRSKRVLAAINGWWDDGFFYTVMMRADGEVVARRIGENHNGNPFRRVYIRRRTPSGFRDQETLNYIADIKGFRIEVPR